MIIDIENNNRYLTPDNCRSVNGVEEETINEVKAYLQGAVYCWCKNVKNTNGENEWFAARDFLGGENFYWEDTPMMALYEHYKEETPDGDYAQKEAGKAAGRILKQLLLEDRRTYETRKGFMKREYRWNGEEKL